MILDLLLRVQSRYDARSRQGPTNADHAFVVDTTLYNLLMVLLAILGKSSRMNCCSIDTRDVVEMVCGINRPCH